MPTETERCSSLDAVRTVQLRSRHVGLARSYDKTKVRVELDSHADTSVVGNNVLVLREHTRHVNVTGFDPTVPHRKCKVVDCAVRYVSHEDGTYKLLVINQAILVPELEHCLLCPMQCRVNGVEINECPRFLASDPTDSTHSIIVHDPEDPAHTLLIPLRLDGVISHFECETPSMEEVQGDQYPCYELTASGPEWDPSDPSFGSQEDSWLDYRGRSIASARRYDYQGAGAGPPPSPDDDKENESPLWNLSQVSLQYDTADVTEKDNFVTALESTVRVALVETSEPGVQEMQCGSTTTGKRRGAVDYITLANRWNIPLEKAKRTVRATTQRGVRTCLHPTLSRRFATNDRMLRYHRMPCNLYSDTLYVKDKYKSVRGNKYAQIFATDFGWSRSFGMEKKSEAHEALSLLFTRDGVPNHMIVDNAQEMRRSEFHRKCKEAYCHLTGTEPYSPWQNTAEREIRELKKGAARQMTARGAPLKTWDWALELESYIRSHSAHNIYQLDGRVPETIVSGETADISPYCEYGFWQWVMFREPKASEHGTFPEDARLLGKYLGPAIDTGGAMTARIMKGNGEVVDRSTLRGLTPAEVIDAEHCKRREEFLKFIHQKYGAKTKDSDLGPDGLNLVEGDVHELYEEVDGPEFPELDDELTDAQVTGDYLVNAEVLIPTVHGMEERGKVVRRKRDRDGNPIGTANRNPLLDTRLYEVQFPDGRTEELAANAIAQALWAQCDPDGNQYVTLHAIVDSRKDPSEAVSKKKQVRMVNGKRVVTRSTKGWELLCEWRDGSTSWQKLRDLKESHPLQVAEFAFAAGIAEEPAFNWWVGWVLKKRDRIISLVKKRRTARYLKRDYKFGVEMPKSVAAALALDKANGNDFWAKAIEKEMKNVKIAFRILEDGTYAPSDHQFVRCHMVFDVKMETFTRKARLVAGGHMTKAPATLTYASVVSRETVRIALLAAALNDVDLWAADVMNAYITAPCREKIWTTLGPEWGEDQGKKAIVVRALYGLKSSGAAFREHLGRFMSDMGYKPCKADPDLWMKEQTNKAGTDYYSYILCYVDDLLVLHHDPKKVMDRINKHLPLKPDSVGPPTFYLGAKLKKHTFKSGRQAWGLSASKYVQEAVKNCQAYVSSNLPDYFLVKKAENPFPVEYSPDDDVSPLLDPGEANYFMQLIGIMRWMCEIGRLDICTETSMLSSYSAMPREGHLKAALHVFAYLRDHANTRLVFDPYKPEIPDDMFIECTWGPEYSGAEEMIPPDAPKPLGRSVLLRMFVDSDHAGDKVSRRSRTGYVIWANSSIVDWLSKKQATIEASVFGAEFCAMRHGIETLRGIRYKLRMMGIPVDGASRIFGDNMSVVNNSSKPESTLKKKSNSICYHLVRGAVAMGEALVAHIPTKKNFADLFTKCLSGVTRRSLVSGLLFDIYDFS